MKVLYNTTKLFFLEDYYKKFFNLSPKGYFPNPYIFFTEYNSQILAYNSLINSFFILTKEDYNNYINSIPDLDLSE